jgi:hypothetical protein
LPGVKWSVREAGQLPPFSAEKEISGDIFIFYFVVLLCSYGCRPRCGAGVDSASNRNEYQEYFMGVKAAGA